MQSIQDNVARSRFELTFEGQIGFIDYQRRGGTLVLMHAEVPAQLQGRGFGSALVRAVLEHVRASGERVIPRCPFVVRFMQRHPEFDELRAQAG